jgi:hypothetical protein
MIAATLYGNIGISAFFYWNAFICVADVWLFLLEVVYINSTISSLPLGLVHN